MQMENEKNCGILQTHNPPTQQAQNIALPQIIVIFFTDVETRSSHPELLPEPVEGQDL